MPQVFQENCNRIFGGEYQATLNKQIIKRIKSYYDIKDSITLIGLNNSRLLLEVSIKEFYLFNSVCITYKSKLYDKSIRTREEISLIFLEIVSRVLRYPKFYYTLINYNLPDKSFIKDNILSELLIMFDLDLEDLIKDDFIYYESSSWKLRGYSSLVNIFKYINYLDLIVFDSKEQINNSLKQ